MLLTLYLWIVHNNLSSIYMISNLQLSIYKLNLLFVAARQQSSKMPRIAIALLVIDHRDCPYSVWYIISSTQPRGKNCPLSDWHATE